MQKMKKILGERHSLILILDYVRIKFFLKNLALTLFYIYGTLHPCKILEKSLERFLRKTITDGQTEKHC